MSVERILDKHKIEYKAVGSAYMVHCLSPDHEDKNPSMFVHKYSGWANCKSCAASYNIFKLFNETPNQLEIQKETFRAKVAKKLSESSFFEFPETAVFWDRDFRGISKETLQKFQAFQCADFQGYISFPLKNVSGDIINFIGRDTTDTKKAKYVAFYKRALMLFPLNNDHKGSIILVEGLFDVLNLYDKGLTNARAIFGVDTFTNESAKSLKMQGIDEVIIMLDNDKAGNAGAARIKEILEEEYISNKTIKLAENKDPGDLSKTAVETIKERLYG